MLRIAFDLDGVLADMDGELARQADALFGEGAVRPRDEAPAVEQTVTTDEPPADSASPAETTDSTPLPLALNINARQSRRLWEHVRGIENFWETLAEIEPGTIARLAALAAERRWEIIFLTRRPRSAGATAQLQTQRWLDAKGFSLPSVFVVQGSRGRIAAALDLDVVVDDRPENCLDVVVDSQARATLVWRSETEEVPSAAQRLGIAVVKSVAECLDRLTEMDQSVPRAPSGLVSRVKRALGLSETVSSQQQS